MNRNDYLCDVQSFDRYTQAAKAWVTEQLQHLVGNTKDHSFPLCSDPDTWVDRRFTLAEAIELLMEKGPEGLIPKGERILVWHEDIIVEMDITPLGSQVKHAPLIQVVLRTYRY